LLLKREKEKKNKNQKTAEEKLGLLG